MSVSTSSKLPQTYQIVTTKRKYSHNLEQIILLHKTYPSIYKFVISDAYFYKYITKYTVLFSHFRNYFTKGVSVMDLKVTCLLVGLAIMVYQVHCKGMDIYILTIKTRSNLFFPLGMCLCWWIIWVPEDTCRQGVFLSTSVDMKYCGWLRSIRTLKSIFKISWYQFIGIVNCGLFSTIALDFWHFEI